MYKTNIWLICLFVCIFLGVGVLSCAIFSGNPTKIIPSGVNLASVLLVAESIKEKS